MVWNMSMFLIPPLFAWLIHICWIQRGNTSKYRKCAVFLIYLVLINICTFSISYARGIKGFHFEEMTLSYRVKYIGLGCLLGLIPLAVIKLDWKKTKRPDAYLTNEVRHGNFDLLKITAMAMIILFHYAYGKWDYSSMGRYKLITDTIWMFGELGVNVFALISGYFMIAQERPFKAKKIFLMWIQVLFYSVLSTMAASKMGILIIDQGKILETVFPIMHKVWWYASAYFALYFLAPYINKGMRPLGKKEYGRLIIFLLLAFSALPTFVGIFKNDTEVFFHYNRLIWLIILYCVAGYIRIYGICREKWTIFHWTIIHICTWVLLLLFIVLVPENGISEQVKMDNTYFWHPNSIVMVLLSVSLFMIFKNIKIKENRVISYIASCTFGIYLGHSDRSLVIWNAIFRRDLVGAKAVLIDMVCAFVCIVMTTLLVESVRKQLEKPVARTYDRIVWRIRHFR